MRTLYLECNMGAAGDMLLAGLLELHPQPQEMIAKLNRLGLPGVWLQAEKVKKCGIGGTHVEVTVNGEVEVSEDVLPCLGSCEAGSAGDAPPQTAFESEHLHTHSYASESDQTRWSSKGNQEQCFSKGDRTRWRSHGHTSLLEIEDLISGLALPEIVREHAKAVYRLIAEAEAHVHQQEISRIHFHEVGSMDAIADVVGVCLLMYELQIERVIASPVHVGSGQVRCAHGILPVPAPATAYLLQDVPIYGGAVKGELCTPTGAALLKYFASSFGNMPVMQVKKIGYGMGKKDFAQANCVRALLGETEDGVCSDEISELVCNLDDMTPEELGFVSGLLMQEGALDVYTTAIQMKKNRPGTMLTCMCQTARKEEFLKLLFQHTTTLGVREYVCQRYKLFRRERVENTPYGPVRIKTASGYGVEREKAEYEDLAHIAREKKLSLREVREQIVKPDMGKRVEKE